MSEHEKAEARDDSEGKRRRCCGRDLSHIIVLSLLVGSIRYEKLDHCVMSSIGSMVKRRIALETHTDTERDREGGERE